MTRARLLQLGLVVLSTALAACGPTEDAVVEEVQASWNCDHVVARFYRSRNDSEYWLVEGCGKIGYYRCWGDVFSTECTAIDTRELPGQTAGS